MQETREKHSGGDATGGTSEGIWGVDAWGVEEFGGAEPASPTGGRGFAQANPGVATAATLAVGLGLGMVLGGRIAARAYRRSLVTVVVMALARAVRDAFERRR